MKLQEITWVDAQKYFETHDTVVIPLGSTENHGSHLALGTDFLIPTRLCDYIEEDCDVLITPVVPFGIADHHVSFPGTLTLGYEGLYMVISKIAWQLYGYGARKFIFLNGHGGNNPVLNSVYMELSAKGAEGTLVNWWQLAGDLNPAWKGGHGGAEETAAMLAIDPKYVKMEYYKERGEQDLSEGLKCCGMNAVDFQGISMMVPRLFDKFAPAGWYGPDDPVTATVEWGKEMLDTTGKFIAAYVNEFAKVKVEK